MNEEGLAMNHIRGMMFVLVALSFLATKAQAEETNRYVVWKIPDKGSILFLAQGDNDIKPPGVKMVVVGISNKSKEDFPFNILTDRWTLVDKEGNTHTAMFNQLNIDSALWLKMSEGQQRLIDYPTKVHSGTNKNIVLLFGPKVNIVGFKEVILDSVFIGKPIRIKYERPKKKKDKKQLEEFTKTDQEKQKREATPIQVEQKKRKLEEERAIKLEKKRTYIISDLMVENLRVAPSERWGKTGSAVFGTIVNKGNKTLNEVTIRVYFLDAEGKRIGEHIYHPVLVTRFSSGDQYPLRPSYRKDFGYYVEDVAPSGWSKRIEGEIIDIEFAQE